MKFVKIFLAACLIGSFSLAQEWTEEPVENQEEAADAGEYEEEFEEEASASKDPAPAAAAPAEAPAPEEQASMEQPEETPADAAEAPSEAPAAEAEQPAAAVEEEPAAEPAATAEAAPVVGESGYTVKKGDTLWDLSGQFYQNPYEWGRIWEANREAIRNPHLIYPDQVFAIPDGTGAAPVAQAPAEPVAEEAPAEEEQASAEQPAAEPVQEESAEEVAQAPAEPAAAEEEASQPAPAPAAKEEPEVAEAPEEEPAPRARRMASRRLPPVDMGNDTFLADDAWRGDGNIVRDKERKLLIAQDDVVYLNVGAADGIKPRMRGAIFRRGQKVNDPRTRTNLGYVVKRVGTIQVTDQVGEKASTAVIVTSYEPVRLGDIVKLEAQ